MSKKLTKQDYADAAKSLKCEVAAIKAVATVESGGRSGFDSKGRLLARFEGHRFRKYTGGKYDATHPAISYPYKVQRSKIHDYRAFNEAMELDPHAAMISTSWGMFQPMGEGFDECGFDSVDDMLTSFREGEANQLRGFVAQIKERSLADELRRLDWAGFAKNYNGADYKSNAYDTKMAAAYKKLKSKIEMPPIDDDVADNGETASDAGVGSLEGDVQTPAPTDPGPSVEVKHADNVTAASPPIDGGKKDDPPIQASQGGGKSIIATMLGGLGGAATAVKGWFDGNNMLAVVGVICLTLLLLVWMFRQVLLDWLRLRLIADPSKLNVR